MTRTHPVVDSRHHARIAIATILVAAVPAVLGFQLFATHLGETSRDIVREIECRGGACAWSSAVVQSVDELEDQGFSCRSKPALTDHVVFEWSTTEVEVVDFATALRASSRDEGRARSYCLPPQG